MKTIFYIAIAFCLLNSVVLGQSSSNDTSSSSDGPSYFEINDIVYRTKNYNVLFSSCRGIIGAEYFDLTDITKANPMNVPIFGTDYSMYFQLCGPINQTQTNCQKISPEGNYSVVVGFSDSGKEEDCEAIGEVYESGVTKSSNFKILEIQVNETEKPSGVQLNFLGNGTDSLVLRLLCPENKSLGMFEPISTTIENDTYIVTGNSSAACYVYSGEQLEVFIEKYKFIFIAVGFVVGLIVCLFGFYLWKPTLYLFGTIGAGLPLLVFLFIVCLPQEQIVWLYWVFLGISLVVGLIVGFLMMKLEKVGVCIGGGLLGFFVATILEVTVIPTLNLSISPMVIYYGLIAVLAIIGVLLAYVLHDHILIISTAFCGSYGAIWAVGLILPGFPNPMEIASEYKENHEITADAVTYVYAIAILALSFLGIYIQYNIRRRHKAKKELEAQGTAADTTPDYYKYNTTS